MSVLLVQGFPQRYILPFSSLTRILFAKWLAFNRRSGGGGYGGGDGDAGGGDHISTDVFFTLEELKSCK